MIITVASFKGGVGKTTTAIHLAACLQHQAATVLIDADPNRSATSWAQRGQLPFEVINEWQTDVGVASQPNSPHYRHIVVDTQARPIPADLATLVDSCDLLILPTTPDILALDALVLTIEHLRSIGATQYRILLTAIPPKPSKAGAEVRTMLNEAGLPLFQQGIRRLAAFQKAAFAGTLVNGVKDPRGVLGWEDYQAVGTELLADESAM